MIHPHRAVQPIQRTEQRNGRDEQRHEAYRALPPGPERDTVLALTYCIVVFPILGQGLSIGHVVRNAVTARR